MIDTWHQNIKELTEEAHEIITNANRAAQESKITWQQRDEVVTMVLNDVADQAGLQLARDLLYIWQ
jgi:F0F1-type ATP synthase membrane subunit b/b'